MKTYKVEIDENGTEHWYNEEGKLHREGDQPSVIYETGSKLWYKDGKRHRDGDQPAVILKDGSQYWYNNGKLHREGDQPAVIYADGSKFWHKNGNLLNAEEIKNLSKPSSSCENSIIEVNGQKFKLVKI